MAWWLWTIVGIVVWTACAWLTALYGVITSCQKASNIKFIDFLCWPFCLCFYIAENLMDEEYPFSFAGSINTVATKIERKAELRRLQEMHEVKEEETYPIPHKISEAQWRQAQGTRNAYGPALHGEAYHEWLQRLYGGKSES